MNHQHLDSIFSVGRASCVSFKTNYQILLRHVNFVFQTENSQNYCKAASKVYQILYSTPPFVSFFFLYIVLMALPLLFCLNLAAKKVLTGTSRQDSYQSGLTNAKIVKRSRKICISSSLRLPFPQYFSILMPKNIYSSISSIFLFFFKISLLRAASFFTRHSRFGVT